MSNLKTILEVHASGFWLLRSCSGSSEVLFRLQPPRNIEYVNTNREGRTEKREPHGFVLLCYSPAKFSVEVETMRPARTAVALGLGLAALYAAASLPAMSAALEARQASSARGAAAVDTGVVTTGVATDVRPVAGVPAKCPQPVNVQPDVYPVSVGVVTSADGRKWPAPGPIQEGAIAPDIFNNCTGTGDNPNYASELKTVVIDEDGVEVTGYIHADNYFELYVNGRFVARDSLPMTPFNSSVVRFKARYPMTYAIMGIDWETHWAWAWNTPPGTSATPASSPTSAMATAPTPTGARRPSISRRSTIPAVCAPPLPAVIRRSAIKASVRRAPRRSRPPARRCASPSRRTGRRRASAIRAGRPPSSGRPRR